MPAAASIPTLVVDDQMTMRALVRSGLTQLGFNQITEAIDGEDALRQVIQRPVKLVISDFNMPKVDGLQLLRAIRGHEPIRTTAFIMLTGRADQDLVKQAAQVGVNNYLVKPFTVATLKQKIEAVFGALS